MVNEHREAPLQSPDMEPPSVSLGPPFIHAVSNVLDVLVVRKFEGDSDLIVTFHPGYMTQKMKLMLAKCNVPISDFNLVFSLFNLAMYSVMKILWELFVHPCSKHCPYHLVLIYLNRVEVSLREVPGCPAPRDTRDYGLAE